MSAPERPEVPDADVLVRVLDGLRALPQQTRRAPDDELAPAGEAPAVPLPRRR